MKQPEEPKLSPLQQAATSRKLIEAEIISRAWADEAFRGKLEADPASALAETGLPVPQGKTVKVVAETPGVLTLVIPPLPVQTEEANDDELAAVAGGGLVENGKCKMYDQIKTEKKHGNTFTEGLLYFCAGATAITGISWGWG